MTTCISRHRITYTPSGGEPLTLLTPLDIIASEPVLSGNPETQVDMGILAPYASHHTRGNTRATLTFDRYRTAACQEQATARRLELWRYLNEHPEGSILYETAFVGLVSAPLIRWELHATLNACNTEDVDADTSPDEGKPGYHVSLSFAVSFAEASSSAPTIL